MDTERLKKFLKEKGIPVSGLKHELITKVNNSIQIEALGSDLDVKCFQRLVGAKSCPKSVRIWRASTYLRKPGGYTQRSFKLEYACVSVDMYVFWGTVLRA